MPSPPRLRRARCLTCYWHDGSFVAHPYPHGTPTALHPVAAEILSAFGDWTTPEAAAAALDHLTPDTVEEAVQALCSAGLLLAEDEADAGRDARIAGTWGVWAPEGPFFHYVTSDVPYPEEDAPHEPPPVTALPPLFTAHPRADRVLLPRRPQDLRMPYEQVLHERRTVRDFTRQPVALETLSALLATVFGPVDFIDCGNGPLYRRTSPAGGARQELEACVGVLNVAGLEPGVYHYNGLQHSLELLSAGLTREEAGHLCADQGWAGGAAFLVFVTATLERMSVKYPTPRCYRVCLLNAGHLGQTFALTATALGLGPAQTGAFHDSAVAERCRLDNAARIPLYVLAAGHPHPEQREAPPPAGTAAFRDAVLSSSAPDGG
ncbi:SagB/ThcOx family dehydrogenase [Streptomyces sp. JJ36]|uniref:SagB/ThcOx family dehydrogenase n=1 Tax=Streptomyces sp. JJ36 TaxID=2736645 RepID=UPI001F302C66|nr:SagB/ThcOx family dehydrogenase [Streptomyces sp. JJ36]MCF6526477.1 SagB/ThcOx family dehydrogenase [Streptomyces sp. JJ36]